jgi:hypothetical protein
MKPRITKWRIAVAVVLLPVLYVLNVGPLIYCTPLFHLPIGILYTLYDPLHRAVEGTRFAPPLYQYEGWWADRAFLDNDAGRMPL